MSEECEQKMLTLIRQIIHERSNQETTLSRITCQYGQALLKKQVMQIINCGPTKLYALLNDGTLKTCCNGTRVSAVSVAEYIDAGINTVDGKRRARKRYNLSV